MRDAAAYKVSKENQMQLFERKKYSANLLTGLCSKPSVINLNSTISCVHNDKNTHMLQKAFIIRLVFLPPECLPAEHSRLGGGV